MRGMLIAGLVLAASSTAYAGNETFLGWSSDGSWYATSDESCTHVTVNLCATNDHPNWPQDVAQLAASRDGDCAWLDEDVAQQSLERIGKPLSDAAKAPAGAKVTIGKRKGKDGLETTVIVKAGKKQHVEGFGAQLTKAKLTSVSWSPDQTHVAVVVANDAPGGCDEEVKHAVLVFSVADLGLAAKAPPSDAAVKKLVTTQLAFLGSDMSAADPTPYTKGATFSRPAGPDDTALGLSDAAGLYDAVRIQELDEVPPVRDLRISFSADGAAAWIAFDTTTSTEKGAHADGGGTVETDYRVTEIAVQDGGAWKLAGGAWTTAIDDADVTKFAIAGQLYDAATLAPGEDDTGPDDLLAAVAPVLHGKAELAPLLDASKSFLVIGSAPKEKFSDPKLFGKAWSVWKKAGVSAVGPVVAGVAPGGKVGWVAANVRVQGKAGKKAIVTSYRVWFACEKQADGWRVVQAHFLVPHQD